MTEKRFTAIPETVTYKDNLTGEILCPKCEKDYYAVLNKMNKLSEENKQLKTLNTHLKNELSWIKDYAYWMEKDAFGKLFMNYMTTVDEFRIMKKENEQLKKELKEFKDHVFSDEEILCYSCVNCISKGIYEVECSEKGKVDVHGSCFSYWKKELQE